MEESISESSEEYDNENGAEGSNQTGDSSQADSWGPGYKRTDSSTPDNRRESNIPLDSEIVAADKDLLAEEDTNILGDTSEYFPADNTVRKGEGSDRKLDRDREKQKSIGDQITDSSHR